MLRCQGRRQWQLATRQSRGEADEIPRHPLPLAGKHCTGATESGRHLVADQKNVVLGGELPQRSNVAAWLGPHPHGTLHDRLYDDRREIVTMLRQHALGFVDGAVERLLDLPDDQRLSALLSKHYKN